MDEHTKDTKKTAAAGAAPQPAPAPAPQPAPAPAPQPAPAPAPQPAPAPAPQPAPAPAPQPAGAAPQTIAPGSPGNPAGFGARPAPAPSPVAQEPKQARTVGAGVTAAIAGGALLVGLVAGGGIVSLVTHLGDDRPAAVEHAEGELPGGPRGDRGGDMGGFGPQQRGGTGPDASEDSRGAQPDSDATAPDAGEDSRGSAPESRGEATPDASPTPEDAAQGA